MAQWLSPRVRRAVVAGFEAGTAAGIAWWLGRVVLDVDRPLYAPVAAVVVIGAGYERRIHRGGAMLSGMALAVVVTEVAMHLIGHGTVQIGLLTAVTIVIARLLLDDLLAVSYAGLNAAILVAIGGQGWVPDRLIEALLGAGVAYGLLYLVFPPQPSQYIERVVVGQVESAVSALRRTSEALRGGGTDAAVAADETSGDVDRQQADVEDTFDFSREISRFSPWRRHERQRTEEFWRRARDLQSVLRDATALVRVARRHVEKNGDHHEDLSCAMGSAAEALEGLESVVCETEPSEVRSRVADVARLADEVRRHAGDIDDDVDAAHIATIEELRALADGIDDWVATLGPDGASIPA